MRYPLKKSHERSAFLNGVIAIFLGSLFLLAPPVFGAAENAQDTLVVSLGTSPLSPLDPALTTSRQILVLYHNWGDTLLYRDPVNHEIVPCLAESYQYLDEKTLEFTLRKGVLFHNKEPFNAEAVRFSMERLKMNDSLVARYLKVFTDVDVVDAHTIRFKTAIPVPTALDVITNTLFIYPPRYYRQVGKEGFNQHPIGTGPYRFVSRSSPSEVVFEANPDYFNGPKGEARIPNLDVQISPEEILQVESLIKRKVDLLRATNHYQEQLPFLRKNPFVNIKSVGILRTCFLVMDATGRSGVGFFKDRRVRRAINHAIDKNHIVRGPFNTMADPIKGVCTPLHFGYEPDVMTYPYDPKKARRLLRAAGYPDGFEVDFYAGISEGTAEVIVEHLKAVGITANLKWMGGQWYRFYKKFLEGEMPLALLTWGSYSIFDASAIMNPFFVRTAPGCYGTTSEVDRLLRAADATIEQERRKAFFSQAQKIIAREAFWVPLVKNRSIAVMNRALNFQPSYDEIDRYFTASWQTP